MEILIEVFKWVFSISFAVLVMWGMARQAHEEGPERGRWKREREEEEYQALHQDHPLPVDIERK